MSIQNFKVLFTEQITLCSVGCCKREPEVKCLILQAQARRCSDAVSALYHFFVLGVQG